MSCVEVLNVTCEQTMRELATTIEGEMRGIVSGHSRSWAAYRAIHIEMGGSTAFVGGTGGEGTKHLGWLNDGNGSGRIHAKGRALGKYPGGIPGIGWRSSVSTYAGIHFVEQIAARHR